VAALAVVVIGVACMVYLVRGIRVDTTRRSGGDDVSIHIPGGGQLEIRGHEKLDPEALGVPIYPDARRTDQKGGATFSWTSQDGQSDKALSIAAADYVTADSAAKVLEWYRSHLPDWTVATDHGRDDARFELSKDGFKRVIAIREKSDGTHIAVATFGKPASN
jgi:hypothetical protein